MPMIPDALTSAQSTTTLKLEERRTVDGVETRTAVLTTWDRQPLTRQTGWDALVRSQRQHPERYAPNGGYRLVLVEANGGDR